MYGRLHVVTVQTASQYAVLTDTIPALVAKFLMAHTAADIEQIIKDVIAVSAETTASGTDKGSEVTITRRRTTAGTAVHRWALEYRIDRTVVAKESLPLNTALRDVLCAVRTMHASPIMATLRTENEALRLRLQRMRLIHQTYDARLQDVIAAVKQAQAAHAYVSMASHEHF